MEVGGSRRHLAHRPKDAAVYAALVSFLTADGSAADSRPELPRPVKRRGYNWQARHIVQEIAALTSVDRLCELECGLRSVLVSQETRRRVKLTTQALFRECNMEEVAVLAAEEEAHRANIRNEAARTFFPVMNTCAVMVEEEMARREVVLEYREVVRWRNRMFRMATLMAEEAARRADVADQATLERCELFQRRLIDVGQELQFELARQNAAMCFTASRRYASDFVRSRGQVCLAEEKDRVGLEKLCFLHLSLLYREAQAALFTALQRDVVAMSASRAAPAAAAAQRHVTTTATATPLTSAWPTERDDLEARESRLRGMIEGAEQDAYQSLICSFTIDWRDVHARIVADSDDTARLVSSLELFERRFIHDEERRSRASLLDDCDSGFKAVAAHQRQLMDMLAQFSHGAAAIWREEHETHLAHHRWHHETVCRAKSIAAAKVVVADEDRCRARLRGEEVRAALAMRRAMQLDRCLVEAANGARCLEEAEGRLRGSLIAQHWSRARALPLAALAASEAAARIRVETEEDVASIDLRGRKERLMRDADLLGKAEQLLCHESEWRAVIISQQGAAALHLQGELLCLAEHAARADIRCEERHAYESLHLAALQTAESVDRGRTARAASVSCAALFVSEVVQRETLHRERLRRIEEERRGFLTRSTHYQNPFLRACIWDELTHRLDIVMEAELTVRSLAYRQGHDAHVSYCADELLEAQRQVRYFSLEEVCALEVHRLVTAVEPEARAAVECDWQRGFLQAKLVFEEGRSRSATEMEAMGRLRMVQRHCRAGADLLRGFASPPTTGDDVKDDPYNGSLWSEARILSYLQQTERRLDGADGSSGVGAASGTASSLSRVRAHAHAGVAGLLVNMYLARDTSTFQEAVNRQRLAASFASAPEHSQRQGSDMASPFLEVHSALIVTLPQNLSPSSSSPSAPSIAGSGNDEAAMEPVLVELSFDHSLTHCAALAHERTASLLAGSPGSSSSTRVILFTTSAMDRRWPVDYRGLPSPLLFLRMVNARGDTIFHGHYELTKPDVASGCAVVDLCRAGGRVARVKLLLHV